MKGNYKELLPKTGDNQDIMFTVFGTIMVGLAAILVYKRK
ncbi:LPXTG cell wall anchor domain-containing protein [Lactococcus formosensis]